METATMKRITTEPEEIKAVMEKVSQILTERGYDPILQITGYIISGDPAYITSYHDARKIIQTIDRNSLIEELVRSNLSYKK